MGKNCSKCDTLKEVYYQVYCPKCDIQKIIKEDHGSLAIFPIMDYGEKFVEGVVKDTIWSQICKNDNVRNDVYLDYYLGDNEGDKMLKQTLDVLNIPYPNDKIFLWISW